MMRWGLGTRTASREADLDRAYARWAPLYPPRPHNRLMEVEQAAMVELLPSLSGCAVVDVGCGTGRYLALAAAAGARLTIGVDRSPDMLHAARVPSARLIRGDLRSLPLATASIDVVLCGLVLMDVTDLEPAMREMARVLRRGGTLLYSTLHPSGEAEGWTRTFDAPDGRHELPSHWHSIAQHQHACHEAGLVVHARVEPTLGGPSPSRGRAVALVVRATKVT